MTALEEQRISEFSRLLVNISQEVTKEQFDQIQLICCTEAVFRPRALANEMRSTAQILTNLQVYSFLSINNLAFLYHVLSEIGRIDLANKVKAFERSRIDHSLPVYGANETTPVFGQLASSHNVLYIGEAETNLPGCDPQSPGYASRQPVPETAASATGELELGYRSADGVDTQDVEMMDTDETEYNELADGLTRGNQPRWQQPQDAAYQPVAFGHHGTVHGFNVLQLEALREQLSRLVDVPTYQIPWLSKGASSSFWTLFLLPNQAVLRLKTLAEKSDEGLLGLGLKWIYIPATGQMILLGRERSSAHLLRNTTTSLSKSKMRGKPRYYRVSKKLTLRGKPQDVRRVRLWKLFSRASEIDTSLATGIISGKQQGNKIVDEQMTIKAKAFNKFYEKISKSRTKYKMDLSTVLSKGKALEENLSTKKPPRESPIGEPNQTSKVNAFADRNDSGFTGESDMTSDKRMLFARRRSDAVEQEAPEVQSLDSLLNADDYAHDVDAFMRQTVALLGTYQSQFEKYIRRETQLKQKLWVLLRENNKLRMKIEELDMESCKITDQSTEIKSSKKGCLMQ